MNQIQDLQKQIDSIVECIENGDILRDFIPAEALETAKRQYVSQWLALRELKQQLEACMDAEKTKFRQLAQAQFTDAFSSGGSIGGISNGYFTATPRYSRVVPYSVAEIHHIFQHNGLKSPPIKSTIDTKLLDAEQRKLYKTLEKVVGVSCIVKSVSGSEDPEE